LVRGIGNAAALMIAAGGGLDATKLTQSIYNNEALVMRRFYLYEDQYVQMRLHLFPDAAETYVHNHRTNFISMALAGSYVHQTWQIRNGQDASSSPANASPDGRGMGTDWHYERTRDSTGALTPRQCVGGSLHMADTFRHDPQHAYFLQNQLFHSVQVEKVASMLSLFVKDNYQNGGTKVLEPREGDGPASLAALPEVMNSFEFNLEGASVLLFAFLYSQFCSMFAWMCLFNVITRSQSKGYFALRSISVPTRGLVSCTVEEFYYYRHILSFSLNGQLCFCKAFV
jgi:hypothetical protein